MSENIAIASDVEPVSCLKDDTALEHWTVLRYAVLGGLLFYRVYRITRTDGFATHPVLSASMTNARTTGNFVATMMWGFILWVQEEGVGFTIYFTISAAMDTGTIFLLDDVFHDEGQSAYCEYVKQTALYSMALLSFLPCVSVALFFQGSWYEKGQWMGLKGAFILLMIVVTMVSFVARLYVVFNLGWANLIQDWLMSTDWKVTIAVLVPPVVDAVQSLILIYASGHAKNHQDEMALNKTAQDENKNTFTQVRQSEDPVLAPVRQND